MPKMRWSNVLKKEKAEDANKDVSVLEYTPKQIKFQTPDVAKDYLTFKEQGSEFVLSEVLRKTTGIDEIERISEEQKIENKALEKLSLIQEKAYKSAYDLGLKEGTDKALASMTGKIDQQLSSFDDLLTKLQNLKEEIAYQNESHLIQLVFEIAKKIAMAHIEEHPETVLNVIKKAIEETQAEEEVTVFVAQEQIEYLEKMKQLTGREFEFMKKINLESSDQVTPGGCIIESNYGIIDSRIKERVEKLWSELKPALPKVKDTIS